MVPIKIPSIPIYLSFSHIMLKLLRTTKFTTYSSLKTPTSLFGKTKTHTHTHTHSFLLGFFFFFFSWLNFYSKWLKICVFFFPQFCSRQNLRFFWGINRQICLLGSHISRKKYEGLILFRFYFQIYKIAIYLAKILL
jgi:hypothetical protein